MFKNTASQKIIVYAYDTSAEAPKTGDAANITAQLSKDGGAAAATNDVNPTELDATNLKGLYAFDMTQTEVNADLLALSPVSSTGSISIEPVIIYTVTPMRGTDSAATAANLATVDTVVDAIKAVTDLLPDAGALNDLAAILTDTGTTLPAQISGLNNLSAAAVNAEVVDVMTVDTIAEMAQGIPPTTPTIIEAIMYQYMAIRNAGLSNASEKRYYNNAGVVIWKKALSDDGTDYTEAKGASGP